MLGLERGRQEPGRGQTLPLHVVSDGGIMGSWKKMPQESSQQFPPVEVSLWVAVSPPSHPHTPGSKAPEKNRRLACLRYCYSTANLSVQLITFN